MPSASSQKDVKDRYAAPGVIQEKYKPIPTLQRLHRHAETEHVSVFAYHTDRTERQPFEIQIRTRKCTVHPGAFVSQPIEIQRSQWRRHYCEEVAFLSWLRQILYGQQDMPDKQRVYESSLKSDLDSFADASILFYPKWRRQNLPRVINTDRLCLRHSFRSNKMIGAKVNGKPVTIDYKIRNYTRSKS